jgi:hypothetical protein
MSENKNSHEEARQKREREFNRYQEIKQQEQAKVDAQEQEKSMLLDKSVDGGRPAPRPTDEYIKKSLGEPRTENEKFFKIEKATKSRYAQEKANEENKKEVKVSLEKHNQSLKKNTPSAKPDRAKQRTQIKEKLRQQRQQAQGRKRTR